jgi:uncharacterized protein (DUF1778 family)
MEAVLEVFNEFAALCDVVNGSDDDFVIKKALEEMKALIERARAMGISEASIEDMTEEYDIYCEREG